MRLYDLTALVRPIDPHAPTNRAIAALTLLVATAGTIAHKGRGVTWTASISWGIGAGLAVFLAWALARELDPDHDRSAFLAAGLALVGLLFAGLPGLLALFWIVLVMRIVNRTVGLPARLLDSLSVLGLGGWLTLQSGWIYGLGTALAFLLDGWLFPRLRRQLLFAGVALAGTAILTLPKGELAGWSGLPLPLALATGGVSALFVTVIVASRQVMSVCDQTGEPLHPSRVQSAQGLALLIALLVAWWQGEAGILSLLLWWAAVLGVVLYGLFAAAYRRV